MRLILPAILLLLSCYLSIADKARYDNYRIHRVIPKTTEQLILLQNLERNNMFSFWRGPIRVNLTVDVVVPPHMRPYFDKFLNDHRMLNSVLIQDMQKLLDKEDDLLVNGPSPANKRSIDWKNYYPLEKIYEWLYELQRAYRNVTVVNAGHTYEGRQILGIEIRNGYNLPGVVIESGVHGREWIGPAVSTFIVNEIIKADEDSVYRRFNFLFFPVFNPDGYAYTFSQDRLWRKTRKPYTSKKGILCFGADLNRNWNYHWNEGGSSPDPCSESYAGPKPFSEIEGRNLANFFKGSSRRYDIYLSFHSYNQVLMYPWGYTNEKSPYETVMKRIALIAATDLAYLHATLFKVGSIPEVMYIASGNTIDWYHGNFNSTLNYVFELRDDGKYGYLLPANQIIPSGEETIAAVKRILTEYETLPPKPITFKN